MVKMLCHQDHSWVIRWFSFVIHLCWFIRTIISKLITCCLIVIAISMLKTDKKLLTVGKELSNSKLQSIKLVPNSFCWLQPFHFSSSSVLITINLENRMYSLLNHSNWLLWAYMAFCWHNVQHSSESVKKQFDIFFRQFNLPVLK